MALIFIPHLCMASNRGMRASFAMSERDPIIETTHELCIISRDLIRLNRESCGELGRVFESTRKTILRTEELIRQSDQAIADFSAFHHFS